MKGQRNVGRPGEVATVEMIACVLCGSEASEGGALCAHHLFGIPDEWATSNRIMCDFLHRGVIPRRLSREEREDPEPEVEAA